MIEADDSRDISLESFIIADVVGRGGAGGISALAPLPGAPLAVVEVDAKFVVVPARGTVCPENFDGSGVPGWLEKRGMDANRTWIRRASVMLSSLCSEAPPSAEGVMARGVVPLSATPTSACRSGGVPGADFGVGNGDVAFERASFELEVSGDVDVTVPFSFNPHDDGGNSFFSFFPRIPPKLFNLPNAATFAFFTLADAPPPLPPFGSAVVALLSPVMPSADASTPSAVVDDCEGSGDSFFRDGDTVRLLLLENVRKKERDLTA